METVRKYLTGQKITDFKPPKEIGRGICEGCRQHYTLFEGYYIGGENKGAAFEFKAGCICEDLQLAAESLENAEKNAAAKIQHLFNNYSLMNEKLKHCTFESYEAKTDEQRQALEMARQFVQDVKAGIIYNLIFSGLYGVGKSHLAAAAMRELMDAGKTCVFCTMPQLLRKIRSSYGQENKHAAMSEDDILTTLETVDVLFLDDLGADRGTDWAAEIVLNLVEARAGRATFYTTNLDAEQLNEHIGSRNFSKLMQDMRRLRIIGDDYRLRGI